MAANDRNINESEHGCYPWQEMKDAHDKIREAPEKPHYTSTEKLMKPQDEEPEG